VYQVGINKRIILRCTANQISRLAFFRFSYECILNTKIFELKDCFNVAQTAVLYVNDQVAKTVKQLFIKIPLYCRSLYDGGILAEFQGW
jgi:hypothetical protein